MRRGQLRFQFILAPHLGMTVGELRERVSVAEMVYWRAMYRIQPWGTALLDAMQARWCALFANTHRKKGTKLIRDHELLLFPDRDQAPDNAMTSKAAAANLRRQFRAMSKG